MALTVNRCLRCRRNRAFCTKERPSCLTCRKGNYECVYSHGRRVSVLASYVGELKEKVRVYEALLGSQQLPEAKDDREQAAENLTPDTAGDVASSDVFDFNMQPLNAGLENLVIGPSGQPCYLGSSSSTILGRRLRDAVGIACASDGELEADREIATYNADALRLRKPSYLDTVKLPPHAVARRYFAAQYTMIGTIFAFVSLDDFEAQLQQAYLGPPNVEDIDACLAYCQIFLIMGFGQMYAINQYTDSEGPPGFAFFTQALQCLPEIHEEPSVRFCGVLALIGYFMQNLNRRDAAFMYLGLAQRMAITLALHEEVSLAGLDDTTKEQRRRTWWSIYSLDRILCVKYGNPITMHDEDISVALPSLLPHESGYCPVVTLRQYTLLSKILSQIMDRIYTKTPKSGSNLMTAVQDIMTALITWERDLPEQLHFDPIRIIVSRESVSTYLHYYQCVNMTARPLLFYVVEKRLQTDPIKRTKDWRQDLSPITISVIETCLAAARNAIHTMTIAAEKNLVAVFGYMDGEHAFSACIALVMACIAFPYDPGTTASMKAGLHLLENMASMGNHHIEARHQMLLQLISVAGATSDEAHTTAAQETPGLTPPVLDVGMLDQIFLPTPATGDLNMFEEAYHDTDLNIEFDLGEWTNCAAAFSTAR